MLKPTVLVVEDEMLVSDMIVAALIDYGFAVRAVANADDALDQLAEDLPVDVLFTDVQLPGPVDGVRLAKLARDLRPHLAVVYTSGRVQGVDQVPGSAFLPKPYEPEQVCALLSKLTSANSRLFVASTRACAI